MPGRAKSSNHRPRCGSLELYGSLPAAPRFYAWWLIDRTALPGVPLDDAPPHLLYIGIAPARASSRATLRSRVLGGQPRRRQPRRVDLPPQPGFTADDNAALTAWQFANLRLTWAGVPEPWTLEPQVIADLRPPLNVDHNSSHPFCATMKAARADCLACATPWP